MQRAQAQALGQQGQMLEGGHGPTLASNVRNTVRR
jgi:hypothetical protein